MANKQTNKTNTKKVKKPSKINWILLFTITVIAIPLCILGYILLTSVDTQGEPVEGERFVNQLDPAIPEGKLEELEQALMVDGVESVSINLKSATLRINVNTVDTLTFDQMNALVGQLYHSVDTILPTATYFTNTDGVKMYDLEIHTYNFIPEEGQEGQIYAIAHKNAAEEGSGVDWLTNIKDQATYDAIQAAKAEAEAAQNTGG